MRHRNILRAAALALLLPGCGGPAPSRTAVAAPAARPSPLQFHDVAASAGITFRLGHTRKTGLNILESIGHGCAFLDYDGDGRLDILLVANDHCVLYRNLGGGKFQDVTDQAFPGAPRRATLCGCAVADYDGDGRPDIFITGHGRTILYHNQGDGTFKDVTAGSGLEARGPDDWTTSAAWADTTGTGRLDLYVCRYVRFGAAGPALCPYPVLAGGAVRMACGPLSYPAEKGSLYRFAGGRFQDVTHQAGFDAAHGNALACMFARINEKGPPVLYIANDQKPGDLFVGDAKGRYANRAVETGVAFNANGALPAGMGVDWADYDGDGRLDLVVGDFSAQPKSLYHNEGGMLFSQASYTSGIGTATLRPLAFSVLFLDADNDGRPDLALANGHVLSDISKVDAQQTYEQPTQLLHNIGGRFEDVSASSGDAFTKRIVGRGAAVGDFDGDGRPDLLIVDDEGAPLLLHNDTQPAGHWITLSCLRAPKGSPAVGALVTAKTADRSQISEVRASGSYLSTNAPDIHFGLGAATSVEELTIHWPDGKTSHIRNAAADHRYSVSPGAAALTPLP